MLLGEPPRTAWDLHFSLFGIPVRVHPFFWLVGLLLGAGTGSKLVYLLVWIAAFFVAILVHELGHALVVRTYGFSPSITLYGLGGLTSWNPAYASRGADTWGRITISAAGPGAGFLLAAAIVAALVLLGPGVEIFMIAGFLPYIVVGGTVASPVVSLFLQYLISVCVFWGIVNLLPVYPLDGGQIAREICLRLNPYQGIRQSLILSIITAVGVAVVGVLTLNDLFIALMFGILAYLSYVALQATQGRGPW